MAKPAAEYALSIRPVHLHGTTVVRAEIVRVDDEGKLINPGYSYKYDDGHLQDFVVTCYAHDDGRLYGFAAEYREAFSVDLKRAEGMVKHLRKVQRGMDKLTESEGYLTEDQYADYIIRVARVLGIKSFYTRNRESQRQMTGERYRRGTGYAVQAYIDQVREDIGKGLIHAYNG